MAIRMASGVSSSQIVILGLGYAGLALMGLWLKKYSLEVLALETLIILIAALVELTYTGRTKGESADAKCVTQENVKQKPLSKEEEDAVVAAKRILEKGREQFLKENNGFVPQASSHVQNFMKEALVLFQKNLDPHKTAEGEKWSLQYSNEKREIKIYSANFPGHACLRWKVETILTTDLESAYDANFVPQNRRKWDSVVKEIDMPQIYDCPPNVGDGIALTTVVTNPIMVVSSRSMMDIAILNVQPRGGLLMANVSCPDDFPERGFEPLVNGAVRAKTLIGSGALLEAIPGRPGKVRYVMVSCIDLGGWLPPSVVNAVYATSLAQSTSQMQDYLQKSLRN